VSTLAQRSAVVFDRQPLWLEALSAVLERTEVRVAARTTTPGDALEALEQHRPDLFLTEPDPDGAGQGPFGTVRKARELVPKVKVVVLSSNRELGLIEEALAAGAVAYVIKTAHPDDIASAVRQAFDHSVFIASAPVIQPAAATRRPEDVAPGLTRREVEILRLVSEGHSNAQLARMLWVTEQTVKFHLSNIYRKLGVANRTEAARWAQVHGLLDSAETVAA
jgi:DNA-binding NarL/FixJ family response regulator